MSEAEEIQISIDQATKSIELGTAFARLYDNKDFKKVFLEDYFREHAQRLIGQKASLGMQDDKNQRYIDGQISGIGHLHEYLVNVERRGLIAKESLDAHRAERDEALAEEV